MEIKKVMESVYVLRDIGACCANLVVGRERALLFDTGCGVEDLRAAAKTVTDLPFLVINSHGHFDHIGGNTQFDKVYLAKEDFRILECYETAQMNGWRRDIAERVGLSAAEGPKDSQSCAGKREVSEVPPREWKCMRELDFSEFDLGALKCRVLPLPGHSAGSVGVLVESLGLLLSGDAMTPVMCMNFYNHMPLAVQLATLRRVEELSFSCYLTSHHDCLFDRAMLERLIHCIEKSTDGRFHRYRYPYPPYTDGAMYVDSLEGEPVALILAEEECPPDAFRRRKHERNQGGKKV